MFQDELEEASGILPEYPGVTRTDMHAIVQENPWQTGVSRVTGAVRGPLQLTRVLRTRASLI